MMQMEMVQETSNRGSHGHFEGSSKQLVSSESREKALSYLTPEQQVHRSKMEEMKKKKDAEKEALREQQEKEKARIKSEKEAEEAKKKAEADQKKQEDGGGCIVM